MLVLARKKGEKIVIGLPEADVVVEILDARGTVKLGVTGPRHVAVHRHEVHTRIRERIRAQCAADEPAGRGRAESAGRRRAQKS